MRRAFQVTRGVANCHTWLEGKTGLGWPQVGEGAAEAKTAKETRVMNEVNIFVELGFR